MLLLIIGRPNINSVNCLLRKSFSPAQRVFIVDHFISLWTIFLMTLERLNHLCPYFCSLLFKIEQICAYTLYGSVCECASRMCVHVQPCAGVSYIYFHKT